jgi:signal transduction histidine kinase
MATADSSPGARKGEVRFVVDAALLFQLGEELVNKRSVALGELIKNAYDADATSVTITFENVQTKGGTIEVADDGTGLSFERIRDAWMRIATSSKVHEPFSDRFRRPRTGAKGIGRFAARRLAHQLEVITVALIDPKAPTKGLEKTTISFDWDAFKPGKQIEEIPAAYRRETVHNSDVPTGVQLKLLNVRDAWTADDLIELRRDLLKLVSPLPSSLADATSKRDPGFAIVLESPEFPELSGDIGETFLSNALGVLEGELQKSGKPSYSLKFRGRRPLQFTPPNATYPSVGRASFVVHFFVYKKDFFLGLPINTREAQERGREEGGVHIYVDRFRVPPYGDPGDDWLKLDESRGRRLTEMPQELVRTAGNLPRPMLLLPGNNQLFGRVFLSRVTNTGIRQTLNRERLIEDDTAFVQLRSFVRLGIDWMTVCYARVFAEEREAQSGKKERNDPVSLLARAKEAFSAAAEDMAPEQRAQVLQSIELARQTVAEQQDEIISELSMLRVLASTGTMIVVFQHQLMGTLTALKDVHTALAGFVSKLPRLDRDRFETELVRLNNWIDTTQHQAQLLGLLISRKARSRRRRLAVRPVVETLRQAFRSYADDYGITVENNVPDGVRTPPMFEAELSAVLVNLLTNAFKAVREQPVRKISVEGTRVDSSVRIRVQDTGVGLGRRDPEEYFKPFVGDSEPDPILGEGTGLGLKIVKDFVGVYGGRARFVPASTPWHTSIELLLPEG